MAASLYGVQHLFNTWIPRIARGQRNVQKRPGMTEGNVHIYLSSREADDTGFALSLRREVTRLKPDATVLSGIIGSTQKPADAPIEAAILLLVGVRWFRLEPEAKPYFADPSEPLRQLLERWLSQGRKIVPLLFQVAPKEWAAICRQLPSSLAELANLNAVEIRLQKFSADVQGLLDSLFSGKPSTPWTETEQQTIIQIVTERTGPLKWYSSRNIILRVRVDGDELGSLLGWGSHFDAPVTPGHHKVQVCEGLFMKTQTLDVDVKPGSTVRLYCERNIFTGGVSLTPKV